MAFVVILFWTCCALLTYVYVLYPALVGAFAARYGKPVRRGDALPTVTIHRDGINDKDAYEQAR